MEELVSTAEGPLYVCGIAMNVDTVLDLFDQVFLLKIDDATQEARLAAYDRANPPGRNDAGRQAIREGRPIFQEQSRRLGASALDGTKTTAAVADELLRRVERGVGRSNRPRR